MEHLQHIVEQWAAAPIMPEADSEEYMDSIIADVINRTNHRDGVKLLFIWWTQVIAFKCGCDTLQSLPVALRTAHMAQIKVLQDNMIVAASDLEQWKADNPHTI